MFKCGHEPRVGSLFFWVDGDTGEVEWWAPMAVCKLCDDAYYLAHEDLGPGGRLDEWYTHEGELIPRGETLRGEYRARRRDAIDNEFSLRSSNVIAGCSTGHVALSRNQPVPTPRSR